MRMRPGRVGLVRQGLVAVLLSIGVLGAPGCAHDSGTPHAPSLESKRADRSTLPASHSAPPSHGAVTRTPGSIADRLEILNLLAVYSHWADSLSTETFGEFFTEDAIFQVVAYGADPLASPQLMGQGRAAIIETLRPRHAAFRRDAVQRRHFLTNPIIWDQTEDSARVAVYLQLQSISQGGAPSIVGTGRYEGVARKTAAGWRMAQWTIFSDQRLD